MFEKYSGSFFSSTSASSMHTARLATLDPFNCTLQNLWKRWSEYQHKKMFAMCMYQDFACFVTKIYQLRSPEA